MPGFLGGSSGSSGTGGEITFPKEFIDPVTKLRVSQPENLIDTDFEYGLQPTKWETVELINNTPSFFSKSGDTTIPGIVSIATNNGTREITVVTATDHGLAVGIPINVTGTKSVTADGSYVINSIPNSTTFTYLCKDEQIGNNAIEDLYSSIITGEFFQGSQIRIADSEGITTDAEPISTLTVKTDSTHGFGLNTPFYFLNLNSTISQEFEASNTAAKSFDSSNSATAQTFDGSNTLSTFNIDWSNSATLAGVTSTIDTVDVVADTITVTHGTETFAGQPLGTPLYYSLTIPASSGYFSTNPRGVVFLKTTNSLNIPAGKSTFQVSETPDGDAIDIVSTMAGTFQLANQARTFAGNNVNPLTQTNLTIQKETAIEFDGGNQGYAGAIVTNGVCSVEGYAGTILVSTTAAAGLDYYVGAMVVYNTTGSAASGLTNNETYFISSFTNATAPDQYRITLKALPTDASNLAPTGGSGTQTFTKIGVSITKDIVHVKNSNFAVKDLIQYSFPEGGRFTAPGGESKLFYFVETAYDAHNYKLSDNFFSPPTASGGVTSTYTSLGTTYRVHAFTTVGTTNFVVDSAGTTGLVDVLVVGGGGGGGAHVPGGGGAGGLVYRPGKSITAQTYPIVVGAGGIGSFNPGNYTGQPNAVAAGNSSALGLTAVGGGWGLSWFEDLRSANGGSGGGRDGRNGSRGLGTQTSQAGESGTYGFGNNGGNGTPPANDPYPTSGGGGAGGEGQSQPNIYTSGNGGIGRYYGHIFGTGYGENGWFAGGGGGGSWGYTQGGRGDGGIGGGGVGDSPTGNGSGSSQRGVGDTPTGASGLANTGGGGGGAGRTGGSSSRGGNGGSGIVLIRYSLTEPIAIVPSVATGGSTSTFTEDGIQYRIHAFTSVGANSFQVTSIGNFNEFDYLIVGGGGGGGGWGGGGGAGGLLAGTATLSLATYSITVGNGGARGTSAYTGGADGGSSSALGFTAFGGGGAGWYNGNAGRPGGSGGGGGLSESSGGPGGSGTVGQGNNGAGAGRNISGFGSDWGAGRGGGGGGAGQAGFDGNNGDYQAGRGGRGRYFGDKFGTNFGQSGWFAGGGGGHSGRMPILSIGGLGGGGRGGRYAEGNGSAALSGTPNTGGGGGGAWGGGSETIGDGGSGIVLIRYPIARV